MITLIVARARDGAIGQAGDIPWHVPEDLHFFQRETKGGAVIMGRRTWESLPVKPLKDRLNIVVSRSRNVTEHCAATVEEAIQIAQGQGYWRLYGIGGAGIYAGLLPYAHRLLITEVDLSVPEADTFFPALTESDWREIRQNVIHEPAPRCTVRELIRA